MHSINPQIFLKMEDRYPAFEKQCALFETGIKQ